MSFPRYPAYKDSGVEWLGEVPTHWSVARFSRVIAGMKDGTHGTFQRVADGLPLLSAKNVQDGRLDISEAESLISHDDHAQIVSCGFPRRGDLLLTIVGTIGRACIYERQEPLAFQRSVCFLRLRADFEPRFFFYLSQSKFFQEQLTGKSKSAAQAGVYMADVASTSVVFPDSIDEQCAIATFLDRETAKIDALIAEQERLIELLKEKRQAVISHAVTKGLDPDVPMKDSGVEWLGEVPAHWDVAATGYRYSIQLGRMLNEERAAGDDLRPYLRVADVQWGFINTEDLPLMDFPPEARERYRLEPGDLLVNEGGSYVGRSAIWRGEISECYYQKALHRLRPLDKTKDTTDFLLLAMEMATRRGVFVASGNQTTIDHLTAEQLRRHRFAFPPLSEQTEITETVGVFAANIADLSNKVEATLELLRERRAALIAAAVTGQIDVRGVAAASRQGGAIAESHP